eukprot:TRINITY_DN62065_c0_g1_i1.p1 TRINITY_DN62065_c0_g1~~TRINITY_DN62065_c0_g1_i1.p1  ORF type:complete len:490 (+),score=36.54 TRINITY_DN62065_c0_g1_i1:32-1471(+)
MTSLTKEELAEEAQAWAVTNRLVACPIAKGGTWYVAPCPFSLYPRPFSRRLFHRALELCGPLNKLVDSVSRDWQFVHSVLSGAAEFDDFTNQLLQISSAVHKEGMVQTKFLGIHRYDYMVHAPPGCNVPSLHQVEINTISAAFPALSTATTKLHRFLAGKYPSTFKPEDIPLSDSNVQIPAALAAAFRANNTIPEDTKASRGVVVFVVQPGERLITDQKMLENTLWEEFEVKAVRMSLDDLSKNAKLDEDKNLVLNNGKIGVVIYFRSGYGPKDFSLDPERLWAARLTVERSTAIKCPSIDYQLFGTKKIQQVLYDREILSKYLDAKDVNAVRECFAPQFALDNDANKKAIEDAIQHPNNYVLKPQREGGGNLKTGDAMKEMLSTLSNETKKTYIMMQKIQTPSRSGVTVRPEGIQEGNMVAELGIYGCFISDENSKTPVYDKYGGHLLRSKMDDQADGGVAAGVAVLDAPVLVDDDQC